MIISVMMVIMMTMSSNSLISRIKDKNEENRIDIADGTENNNDAVMNSIDNDDINDIMTITIITIK